MASTLGIGEFARLTYLSVPALRHYHELGVLEPASVDATSGYRRYGADQVATAHLVRRLRELQMPLPEIRAVVTARDQISRDRLIGAHLEHMEHQLTQTRTVIASLRELLTGSPAHSPAEVRDFPTIAVLGLTDAIRWDDMASWFDASFDELFAVAQARGIEPAGPPGGLFWPGYFEQHEGPVSVYVPLPAGATSEFDADGSSRVRPLRIPAARCAVRQHRGSYDDLDITYGTVGLDVAAHHQSSDGPMREIYLIGPGSGAEPADYRTDVCWPIETATAPTVSRPTPGGSR
jgi:DNA-binding transcriptional MerR regulator